MNYRELTASEMDAVAGGCPDTTTVVLGPVSMTWGDGWLHIRDYQNGTLTTFSSQTGVGVTHVIPG
jgi:hypothetical protein